MTVDDCAMDTALAEYVEASNNLRDKLLHEALRLDMVRMARSTVEALVEKAELVDGPAFTPLTPEMQERLDTARNIAIDMKREAELAHQAVENARAAFTLASKKHLKALGLRQRI